MAGYDKYSPELARCVAENLFIIRRRAGLSQEQLADLAGLHRTEIGNLERGVRLARIDTVVKLAGALEIAPGDLLKGMAWLPSKPSGGSPGGKFVTWGPEPRDD
jgi:transcriptional regulator with XRE-family HTH domain